MTRNYDYRAWTADPSIVPADTKIPSDINANDDRSYFYIKTIVDLSTYLIEEEEEEDEIYGPLVRALEDREHVEYFEIPAFELIDESTSWSTISNMLSAVQIPIDAQRKMAHRISYCARSMAKASHNIGSKVLPMIVCIDAADYVGADEVDVDDNVMRESVEGTEGPREGPASEELVEARETVRVEDGLMEQRMMCQDDIHFVWLWRSLTAKAFLHADRELADDCSTSTVCGTKAPTALVLGRHLLVANAGDCRAVPCRNGDAVLISQDHRPTYLPERRRVEELGGIIEFGCLNGELAVTRALGDWNMKRSSGSASPLIAESNVHQILLTEDDEFFIMASDGIWDVIGNQEAVDIVRRDLSQLDDTPQCVEELVDHASVLKSKDNLSTVVVCFT
ncbi:hypothetical protein RHSIM_Rhsim08G0157800 [Rhododendron simsii]|uniref:PPM-type phosphatase domain-containing protein n=1 Tax=Rhododendron simsii TaxID=118357 RepID=A0A834GSA8_RHOSS|nr:hypothetical protein RHSIM_Rhsim08G0157800 [Rhododendron simsii]